MIRPHSSQRVITFSINRRLRLLNPGLGLSLIFFLAAFQGTLAQNCPGNNTTDIRTCFSGTPSCTGSDVTLIGLSVGDPNEPCETCTPGQPVTLPLIAEIRSDNNGNRCTFTLAADLLVDGVFACTLSVRLDTCIGTMGTYFFEMGSLTFTCGEALTLSPDLILGWATNGNDNGNPNFCPNNSKCGLPGPIAVRTPLIATCQVSRPVACFGEDGDVTAVVTGGTLPYSFSWSNGMSDSVITVAPGTYDLTVSDANGCTSLCSVTLPAGPGSALTAACVNGAVSCFGDSDGTVSVNPAGGTPNYTYLWNANAGNSMNQTVTGLPAGNYTVTVTDANGCQDVCTANISQPQAFTCSANQDQAVRCNGESNGQATVTPTGGNGGNTYLWDNGETNATATMLNAGLHTVTVTDNQGCTTSCSVTITQPSALTCTAVQDQAVRCNGESNGQATVTPAGGNGGNTYLWDNGETNATATMLNAGLHTVTVTDNQGCTTSCSVTITQPSALTCTAVQDQAVRCNGESNGQATVTPAGGNGGNTYLWDNGETNATATMLNAGLHTVTVTDNQGCTTSCSVTITQPSALTCTAVQDQAVRCNGESNGQATVTPTGGNGGNTYLWDNGETNATATMLNAGLHTVTVTDNQGCTTSCSVTITQPAPLTCTAVEDQAASCSGFADGEATVTASGGNGGYSYSWDNGEMTATATMLTAGTHSVTITDALGCNTSCTVTITQPSTLSCTAVEVRQVLCNGESNGVAMVTATGGNGGYGYLWDNGETSATATMLNAGTHTVTVTDAQGCMTSCVVDVTEPAILGASVTFSCNPDATADLDLAVTGGTPGFTYQWDNGLPAVQDPTNVPQNMTYNVTVTDANGCTATASVTVQGCCLLDIVCPAPTNVACLDDTTTVSQDMQELMANIVAVPPPCNTPTITLISRSASGSCGTAPGYEISRVYEINDGVTTLQCTKLIRALDNVPPALNPPPSAQVECLDDTTSAFASLGEFLAAGGSASDNCQLLASSFQQVGPSTLQGSCPQLLTRTYSVADRCGNIQTAIHGIIISDVTPPVVNNCPAGADLGCFNSGDPSVANLPGPITDPVALGATDNCSATASLVVSNEDVGPIIDGCSYTFHRIYSVSDECGNTTFCDTIDYRFTFDIEAPVFDNVPPTVEFGCFDPVPAFGNNVTASDNCDGPVTVTFTDSKGNGGCLRESYTRIWTAVDACGNVATARQNLIRVDFTPPEITRPADTTIYCGQSIPEAEFDITDDCTDFEEHFTETIVPSSCACNYSIMRIWTAENDCQEVARDTQFVHVRDTTPPGIEIVNPLLAGLENGGVMEVFNCDIPRVFMTDILTEDCCGIADEVAYDSLIAFNTCEIYGYFQRWVCGYRVTDLCGNVSEFAFFVDQYDTLPPTFIGMAPDTSIECGESIPDLPLIEVDDNCPSVYDSLLIDVDTIGPYPDSFGIIRTWSSVDDCGNMGTMRQKISYCGFDPDSAVGSIGNLVWLDENENGLQEENEAGMNFVDVYLYQDADEDGMPDGDLLDEATTSTYQGLDGFYAFSNLEAGTYLLSFQLPLGYNFTLPAQGENREKDSDVMSESGFTHSIKVSPKIHDISVDAGLVSTSQFSVDLASFDLLGTDCRTELQWRTASEIDLQSFEIQRSSNAEDFETIGVLGASGNPVAGETHFYFFADQAPYNGLRYYRLKMVSIDGEEIWSEIREVNRTCHPPNQELDLYPNPVRDELHYEFPSPLDDYEIEILDRLGRKLMSRKVPSGQSVQQGKLPISGLPGGVYWLSIKHHTALYQGTFIKVE